MWQWWYTLCVSHSSSGSNGKMPTYKFVWNSGYACHMTVPQYDTACLIAEQWGMTHTVTVDPVFGIKDALS